jgi:hypothetical protein
VTHFVMVDVHTLRPGIFLPITALQAWWTSFFHIVFGSSCAAVHVIVLHMFFFFHIRLLIQSIIFFMKFSQPGIFFYAFSISSLWRTLDGKYMAEHLGCMVINQPLNTRGSKGISSGHSSSLLQTHCSTDLDIFKSPS